MRCEAYNDNGAGDQCRNQARFKVYYSEEPDEHGECCCFVHARRAELFNIMVCPLGDATS